MELSLKSLKGGNAMENKIELFERYIDNKLDTDEKLKFDLRLKTDRQFASDFRVYLLTVREIMLEAKREDEEFGNAMMNLPEGEFMRVIHNTRRQHPKLSIGLPYACNYNEFPSEKSHFSEESHSDENNDGERMICRSEIPHGRRSRIRERWAWISSIAVILVIGIFSLFSVRQSGMDKVDDMIVEANFVPDFSRGAEVREHGIQWEDSPDLKPSDEEIKHFEREYYAVTATDIQAQEDAGMRLAMVYLKVHDREKAKALLSELSKRFADDKEFAAQCRKILEQLD